MVKQRQNGQHAPSVACWRGLCLLLLGLCLPLAVCGCPGSGNQTNGTSGRRVYLTMGTAPIGGAFKVVGGTLVDVLNKHKDAINWKIDENGTKGSQENIRKLASGELQLAMSNSAITYFAVRGESGWNKKYDVRAVVTMAPNVAMFITKQDSGIKTIADLKGKRVVVGPSGAGFDMFIQPLLAEHNVTYDDIDERNNNQAAAVGELADGTAHAAFLGGAVPTSSITQACSTHDIYFVPFDPEARNKLVEKYPFFQPITVAADKYSDLTEDFEGLNVGSMHVITTADQDEDVIYQVTKTIWEQRVEITKGHPAGKSINEKNAARYTGTPFHPGAIRFYQEIGIWPDDPGKAQDRAADAGADANQAEEGAGADNSAKEK